MPKATETITTPAASRRNTFAAISTVAPSTRPNGGGDGMTPDAELIRICAEYEAGERKIEELSGPDDWVTERTIEITNNELGPIVERLEEIHAQTPAGIHAIARAVAACNGHFQFSFDWQDTHPHRMLACLLREAARLPGQLEALKAV